MLQNVGVLCILTCTCASGVQFLDIGSSKSAPCPSVFSHFHLQMCFAPQRRTILPDRSFQNVHENMSFSAFWLTNVLRATAACDFWTSERPKLVRLCGVFHILTWTCASRHSGVPFFICLLNSYLRTRHFERLLFEHQEPRIIEQTQRFATSLTFGAYVSSF